MKLYDLTSLCQADNDFLASKVAAEKESKRKSPGSNEKSKKKRDSNCDREKVDASELCPKIENPYTVPVALLLYRVAKNLLTNDEIRVDAGATRMSKKKASTIGTLLTNCTK